MRSRRALRWARALLVPAGLVWLAACAGRAEAPTVAAAARGGRLLDGRTGAAVGYDAFVDDLAAARVVYVGEEHDRPEDHEAQRAILVALAAARPGARLALGVEMVQRPFQPALDGWGRGELSERAMLEGVEWSTRWGFDYGLYRSLFDAARERGVRIVALNARREVTRLVGHAGLEGLDETQRAELPELDLEDAAHRAMVMDALAGHGGADAAMLERFYAAQVVWDETMADTVARALADANGPERMVVVAGRFHVRAGHGVPRRAARRGAAPFRIVLPLAAHEVADAVDAAAPAADYLWVRPG